MGAELPVVDLKIRHRATRLTPPAVATQDLPAQTFVRQGIHPQVSGFWTNHFQDAFSRQVFKDSAGVRRARIGRIASSRTATPLNSGCRGPLPGVQAGQSQNQRPRFGELPVRAASLLSIPVEVIDCDRELARMTKGPAASDQILDDSFS